MPTKKEQLIALYKPFINCTNCTLKRTDEHKMVLPYGNLDAKLIIIGEAPGKNEEEQGIPFIGRSGQLVNQTIERLGKQRSNFFITNAVKCRPQNNRTPSPAEIDAYKNFLLQEIAIIQPLAICTLGAVATQALLGSDKKITKAREQVSFFGNIPVFATYHPAYILRNLNKKELFIKDIQKAIVISDKLLEEKLKTD